jgi:hypothetical protein
MHRTALLAGSAAILAGIVASSQIARGDIDGEIAAITAALPACDAARAHCIGIQLHIPIESDSPAGGGGGGGGGGAGGARLIATSDWLALQLATANRHFAALDVGFQITGIAALPASAAHIATRQERSALADGRLAGAVIHVFITGQLDDIDEPGRVARGVTWHAPDGRKYAIVSTQGKDRTLAHELGHVFGLPHSTYSISIMNKTDRAQPPPEQRTFAVPEIRAMRPVLARLLREHVIADIAH